MEPGGTLETTRITPAFAALLDWLDENPTISAATIGFETMNEPETYDKFRIALGYNNDIAIGYYAQHVINIYNQIVAAGRTGFKFLVGGWDYSRNWDLFGVPSAYLGGKTIVQALRDTIYGNTDGNELCWAWHLYPDWTAASVDPGALCDYLDKDLANIYGDPIYITESNHNGGWVRWDYLDNFYRTHFMFAQIGPWLRKRGISFTYWPANNHAAARLVQIVGDDIELYNQTSFWAFLSNVSMADRFGHFWTGTQHGMLTPQHIIDDDGGSRTITLRNHAREIDQDGATVTYDAVTKYAVGFGGGGYKVITGESDANNFLFGGEGFSVLYGGPNDDYLTLGPGGGVARTGAKVGYVQNVGQGTIYLEADKTLALIYWGESDVIIKNQTGNHVIHGFKPGTDRIGFDGVFANAAALEAATEVVLAETYEAITDEFHTVIALPGGGTVTLALSSIADGVSEHCLDFQGWTEPAQDYDPALFDPSVTPYATIPAAEVPTTSGGGGPVLKDGSQTTVRLKDGTAVALNLVPF